MIGEVLPYSDCTLLILCGGSSSRMGGQDKGLKEINGKPMIQHLTEKLSGQFANTIISCNRHLDEYAQLGFSLVQDPVEDMGPLGGLLSAIKSCQGDYPDCYYIAVVPCDSPFVSQAVYESLYKHAKDSNEAAMVAHDGNRLQMLHAVLNTKHFDLKHSLETFLTKDKAVKNWYRKIGIKAVDCSDYAEQFVNINSEDEII